MTDKRESLELAARCGPPGGPSSVFSGVVRTQRMLRRCLLKCMEVADASGALQAGLHSSAFTAVLRCWEFWEHTADEARVIDEL